MSEPRDTRHDALSEATGTGQTAPEDAYEAMMVGDETVLHRQKMAWPWYFHVLMLLVMLASTVGLGWEAVTTGAMGAWLGMLWIAGIIGLVWSMFYALRVTVTPDKASIKYGLLGPSIPIDQITHCEAENYSVMKYGGWGIRFSAFDGSWAFNMLGDKGKAVRIHYKTKLGTTRKVVVSSLHPHVLADAINRARAAKGHAVPLESTLSDAELGLDADAVLYEETVTAQPPADDLDDLTSADDAVHGVGEPAVEDADSDADDAVGDVEVVEKKEEVVSKAP